MEGPARTPGRVPSPGPGTQVSGYRSAGQPPCPVLKAVIRLTQRDGAEGSCHYHFPQRRPCSQRYLQAASPHHVLRQKGRAPVQG